MNVADAVARRRSVRAFLPDPVSGDVVQDLLTRASQAPSGGNLQPWHVRALTGEPLRELIRSVEAAGPDPQPGYEVYPQNLWDPYRSRRYLNGEQLYSMIGIDRQDRSGRLTQLANNRTFFGAPVGILILIERGMGPPQWADLGIYLQTFMLLAVDMGLDTCPQEFWALYAKQVETFLGVPDELALFCGIAVGYCDHSAPINRMVSTRAPFEEWGELRGFSAAKTEGNT